MSFTPDSEKLSEPLETAANALEALAAPIRQRLKNPSEWSDDHLTTLAVLLRDLAEMEARLRLLAASTS